MFEIHLINQLSINLSIKVVFKFTHFVLGWGRGRAGVAYNCTLLERAAETEHGASRKQKQAASSEDMNMNMNTNAIH